MFIYEPQFIADSVVDNQSCAIHLSQYVYKTPQRAIFPTQPPCAKEPMPSKNHKTQMSHKKKHFPMLFFMPGGSADLSQRQDSDRCALMKFS
jgi:hypothetical protein